MSALAWNLSSQGLSALFGLILIKVSVSEFSVPAYGVASLLLGLHLFTRNAGLNPLLNLAIYASPREGRQNGFGWIYHSTTRCLRWAVPFAVVLFPALIWGLQIPVGRVLIAGGLLSILLYCEAVKAARFNLLHCRDLNSRYAFWIIVDAASKPVAVFLAARSQAGHGALLLVAAQTIASLAVLLASELDARIRQLKTEQLAAMPSPLPGAWIFSHSAFLLPLVGVGLTGWITGLSDRYLVNLFLGAGQAGLYAGVYAIFATPFLILGGALTLAYRPHLLNLQGTGSKSDWESALWQNVLWSAASAGGLGLLLYLLRMQLVTLVLAPAYQSALGVVPGLLIGNAVITVGITLELGFYLRRRTSLVLAKQAVGSLGAIIAVILLIPRFGLEGAGWACPIYASLEFLTGLALMLYLQPKDPA